MNPLDLDWGTATPEFVSRDSSTAIHVINHALENDVQLNRNMSFIRGRIAFFARQLPSGMKQHVIFDDRGQNIPSSIRDSLREAFTSIASFEYMTERG
ncbi:MAG: hypothetical protein J0M26_18395 [Planctomycetes bacterium]|nr:hypothetical protein [Planctomycetota bacterium]